MSAITALTNACPPATGSVGRSPPEIARSARSITSSTGRPYAKPLKARPERIARSRNVSGGRPGSTSRPSIVRRQQRPGAHADHRRADQLDLQALVEVALLRPEARARRLEHLDRAHRLAGELEQARQLERGLRRLPRVLGERDRRLEVVGGRGGAGARLGAAELGQDGGAAVGRRRLGERALEVAHGGGGVAEGERPARRLAQHGDDPLLARGRRLEDLRGDLLRRAVALGEQPRGARVEVGALEQRDVVVDRRADDGVDEGERVARGEHLRAHEQRRGLVGGRRVEPGELGRGGEAGAVAEDGHGARERHGPGGQAREAQQHDARDPARAERGDALRLARGRRDPLGGDLAQQLAHQQRVAGGGEVAGGAEAGVGLVARRRPDPLAHRRVAQRRGAQRLGERVGDELGEDGARRLVARPRADEDEDRQLLQAPDEEGQELQRRLVGPVRVVDGDEQRAAAGDVRGQPVEAVQARERRVLHAGVERGAGVLEHRPRQPGGAGQPRLALGLARLVEDGLEELADDAEREPALELAPAPGEHADPGVARLPPRTRRAGSSCRAPPGACTTRKRPTPPRASSRAAVMRCCSASRSRRVGTRGSSRIGHSPRHALWG